MQSAVLLPLKTLQVLYKSLLLLVSALLDLALRRVRKSCKGVYAGNIRSH